MDNFPEFLNETKSEVLKNIPAENEAFRGIEKLINPNMIDFKSDDFFLHEKQCETAKTEAECEGKIKEIKPEENKIEFDHFSELRITLEISEIIEKIPTDKNVPLYQLLVFTNALSEVINFPVDRKTEFSAELRIDLILIREKVTKSMKFLVSLLKSFFSVWDELNKFRNGLNEVLIKDFSLSLSSALKEKIQIVKFHMNVLKVIQSEFEDCKEAKKDTFRTKCDFEKRFINIELEYPNEMKFLSYFKILLRKTNEIFSNSENEFLSSLSDNNSKNDSDKELLNLRFEFFSILTFNIEKILNKLANHKTKHLFFCIDSLFEQEITKKSLEAFIGIVSLHSKGIVNYLKTLKKDISEPNNKNFPKIREIVRKLAVKRLNDSSKLFSSKIKEKFERRNDQNSSTKFSSEIEIIFQSILGAKKRNQKEKSNFWEQFDKMNCIESVFVQSALNRIKEFFKSVSSDNYVPNDAISSNSVRIEIFSENIFSLKDSLDNIDSSKIDDKALVKRLKSSKRKVLKFGRKRPIKEHLKNILEKFERKLSSEKVENSPIIAKILDNVKLTNKALEEFFCLRDEKELENDLKTLKNVNTIYEILKSLNDCILCLKKHFWNLCEMIKWVEETAKNHETLTKEENNRFLRKLYGQNIILWRKKHIQKSKEDIFGRMENPHAVEVLKRVNDKLSIEPVGVKSKVKELIEKAICEENLCQLYEGWAPWM